MCRNPSALSLAPVQIRLAVDFKKQHNLHALRRLEQLVVRDVVEGNHQSHAVLVFDDVKPMPIEETVDVTLALTCMSQETQRHPALQGSHNNLFTVVVETTPNT